MLDAWDAPCLNASVKRRAPMTRAVDTKILLAVTEVLPEMFRLMLEVGGFVNIELRGEDDRDFFARYRPGDYGLFIAQPSSKPPGMMNGMELLSEVRKHDGRARFLIVSGGPEAPVHQWAKNINLGDHTYLGMPCTCDQLLKAVDLALADHHESAA